MCRFGYGAGTVRNLAASDQRLVMAYVITAALLGRHPASCRPRMHANARGSPYSLSRQNREARVVPRTAHFTINKNAFAEWTTHVRAFGAQHTILALVSRHNDRPATEATGDQLIFRDTRAVAAVSSWAATVRRVLCFQPIENTSRYTIGAPHERKPGW